MFKVCMNGSSCNILVWNYWQELAEMSPSLQAVRVKRFSVFVGTVCVGMCILSVSAWLRKPDSWVDCRVVMCLSKHPCPQFFGLFPSSSQSRGKKTVRSRTILFLCQYFSQFVAYTTFKWSISVSCSCSLPHTLHIHILLARLPCAPLKAPRAFVIYDPCKVLVKSFCADCTFSLVRLWGMKMGH